jgi:hypothetical protein
MLHTARVRVLCLLLVSAPLASTEFGDKEGTNFVLPAFLSPTIPSTCVARLVEASLMNCGHREIDKDKPDWAASAAKYNTSARHWCSKKEATPRKVGRGVVPKYPYPSEEQLGIDWKRTRKLAAQAVLGELKHDPYPVPEGFIRNYSHLDESCTACDNEEKAEDQPHELGKLKGKQGALHDHE